MRFTTKCPLCNSDKIRFQNGCEDCMDCGWSACVSG